MTDNLLAHILRQAQTPDLLDALVERLNPTDLQSLLLEVYHRRATRVTPAHLLQQYEQNRFVCPAQIDPQRDPETILYHTVRGYWLTRFLQDQHPDLLKRLLAQRYDRLVLDREIANAVGLDTTVLWLRIDGIIVDHFCQA